MPTIGIIRGFGEGNNATFYIIRLIKALNRRFRSHIHYDEIPCGSYIEHGDSISQAALESMKEYDCIYIGDFKSPSNPVDYTNKDIAFALSGNIEYTHISGFDNCSDIDVCIASYFDGGFKMREATQAKDGCTEMRVCSTFIASSITKNVSRICESRRRRLAFVKDSDNEYCSEMFYRLFERFVLPLSNFKFVKYTPHELCRDILYNPSLFDVIFSSSAFADTISGAFEFLMKDKFAYYKKYNGEKSVYCVQALQSNSACGDYVPSLCSYIIAFCDLLKNELHLEKEAAHLRRAIEEAYKYTTYEAGDEFIEAVIKALQNPVTTKYSKSVKTSRYIK